MGCNEWRLPNVLFNWLSTIGHPVTQKGVVTPNASRGGLLVWWSTRDVNLISIWGVPNMGWAWAERGLNMGYLQWHVFWTQFFIEIRGVRGHTRLIKKASRRNGFKVIQGHEIKSCTGGWGKLTAFLQNDISQSWRHIFAPSQRWQKWHSFYFAGMLT